MIKFLIALSAFAILGCTNISYNEMPVEDIIAKTTKNMHVWVTTEFKVESTGKGIAQDSGKWFLNSGIQYRSSQSLNVHLSAKVVAEFKKQYGIEDIAELQNRTIRVKGTANPKKYCVKMGCPIPLASKAPKMYIQTQLIIENIDNIKLL